jgi:hypothetical protein
MPSQYRLYPSMSKTNTLSYKSQGLDQVLSRYAGHSLHVEGEEFDDKSTERSGGIPASISNCSLINFDIDTSDFMNMSSPFPWDDIRCAYRNTDPYIPVRYSFESSSSTIQGSYCSVKTSLLPNTHEAIARPEQCRESILIPDFPQDLTFHHIQPCKSRPANLRASSGDSAIHNLSIKRSNTSYKRSVTPSQLDYLAGVFGVKSPWQTHTPQRSLESSYTQDRPTTPSLSFSSTVATSPTSSIMCPSSELEDISATVAPNTACAAVSSIKSIKSGDDIGFPDRGAVGSGSAPVQPKIIGPFANPQSHSMMNLSISAFSVEMYNSERAFQQPCRKMPKPSPFIALPPSPGTSTMQAERPSWLDLDDDIGGQPSKHLNLPTKLSIPHLRLRADSSTKKATPLPAPSIKRRSEDSITVATNILETNGSGKFCATRTASAAHISLPSSNPTSVHANAPQVILKKSSIRSKLLLPTRTFATETLKKKKPKVKVGSSSKHRKLSPGRRFRTWFRRVFD